ncbi:MAG: TonB-dependent receptor [Pseudomonadota bacterium]
MLQGRHRSVSARLPVALAAAACLLPCVANAAPETARSGEAGSALPIEELIVVAHKQARPLHEIAANVSTFDSASLRHELASSVADAFRYAPGIDFETAGSRFGAESINIRGISGNRVAVLLDGVPISDQFNVGSFSNATRDFVNAGFVDQLEVLHGPASALYGSAAIGGVVAMRTANPRALSGAEGQGGRLVGTWRDDNASWHGTAMQAFAGKSLAVLAGISFRQDEEHDPAAADTNLDRRRSDSQSALLKFVFDDAFGNAWQAGFYRQASDVSSDLNSMLGSGRFRSNTALEGDDNYRTEIVSLEYRFGGGLFDGGVARAYRQTASVRQHTYDERGLARRPVAIDRYFAFDQDVRGVELNLQKQFSTASLAHRLAFGVEYRRRETEELRDGMSLGLDDGIVSKVLLGEVFPLRDFPISVAKDWGAYLEDTVSLGRWSLITALRADRYDMTPQVDAVYAEDYPFAEVVSISDAEVSPKLGLIYQLLDTTEIYLQYTQGFRAPPYEDANIGLEIPLFNYRAIPNPDLRSEQSEGFDAGLRWRGVNGKAHFSIFRTEFDDFIESRVRLGPDPVSGRILFQAQNIDTALIEGLEAGGSLQLDAVSAGLSVDLSLFLARGENRDNGEALNSVAPPQAVASVRWRSANDRWRASLRGTFTDGWSDLDESGGELFEPSGHAVFDLYLARQVGDKVTLRAGILNLGDRTYWSWTDVRGLAPDDPVIPYLSRPGRGFTFGIDVDW